MGRREELAAAVAAGQKAQRELERLENLPDLEAMPNGSVIGVVLKYLSSAAPYTYIGYKVRNLWSFTGAQGPNRVSSAHASEWMAKPGRRVLAVVVLAEFTADSVPQMVDLGALLSSVSEYSPGQSQFRVEKVCAVPDCGCSGSAHA